MLCNIIGICVLNSTQYFSLRREAAFILLICFVCGFYPGPRQVKHGIKVFTKISQAYELYFGVKIGIQNKS